jgi:hypothetical protein
LTVIDNPSTQYQLTTSVNPAGAGSITPDCSGGCWYNSGTSVTLTATANSGYEFGSWNGCDNTFGNICYVTMGSDKNITASFVEVSGFNRDLSKGWNFFGWLTDIGYYEGTEPQQDEYATESTLTPVNSLEYAITNIGLPPEDYLVVIGPEGKVYVPDSPFNTLKNLLPGSAYWIYMNIDKTITLPGSVLSSTSTLQLPDGWVQVAYWGEDGLPPGEAFSCIAGLYDVIVDGKGRVYVPNSPFNTLTAVYRTDGYFIHTIGSGTLQYDCQSSVIPLKTNTIRNLVPGDT